MAEECFQRSSVRTEIESSRLRLTAPRGFRDAQTGQLLIGPMKHRGAVHSALFSPDGKRIVTASFTPGLRDGAAQIWDAQTGQPLTEPMKEDDWVWSAHFSPDGKRIVTISHAIARVWDIGPCGTGFPDWLLPLAEALSEKKLTQQGLLEATGQDSQPLSSPHSAAVGASPRQRRLGGVGAMVSGGPGDADHSPLFQSHHPAIPPAPGA